ncbi:MAG: hypothetical protein ACRDBG_07855 [Waterburya sp.]
MGLEMQESAIISGNQAVATYKRNGKDYPVSNIDELVILTAGNIAANAAITWKLSNPDLRTALQPISMWVLASTNNFNIQVASLNFFTTIQANQLTNGYKFVDFAIDRDKDLIITPSIALTRINIFCKPISIIASINNTVP